MAMAGEVSNGHKAASGVALNLVLWIECFFSSFFPLQCG